MSQSSAEYVFRINGFPEHVDVIATWLAEETRLADRELCK